MKKSYYVASTRISPKIADIVEYGHHIVLEDITYERLKSAPRGRSIKKRLQNPSTEEQIIIFN
jgi:hypothetical protein